MSALRAIPVWLRAAFVVAVVTLVGSIIAVQQLGRAEEARQAALLESTDHGLVPEFAFVDQSSRPFGLDQMVGKVSLVSFQFTRCPGICKVMSVRLQEIYEAYASDPRLQIVTVSVDPGYDTPEVLTEYASKFNVTDDRWRFLTGDFGKVKELCEDGFHLPADNLPGGHTSRFVLVDLEGRIRGYYDSLEDDAMKKLAGDLPHWLEKI